MKKFLRHEYDDIGRIYVFDDGSRYYSVTTMLGNTSDKSFLDEWRKRIGIAKAEQITKYAGITGTSVHDCLEQYLLKKHPIEYPNAWIKNLVRQITPFIDKNVKKVYHTEQVLWSDALGLAGTVDGVVDYMINKQPTYSILDFKTATKQPKVSWIRDYFLQMVIYALMVKELYDRFPEYGILLFAYKRVRSRQQQIAIKTNSYSLLEELKQRNDSFKQIIS